MGIKGLIYGIISYRLVRRNEKGVPAPLPIFYCAGFTWEVIEMKVCKVEDCGKNAYVKGFCSSHYKRFLRHGDPLKGNADRGKYKTCTVAGCDSKHYGNGYCIKHNARNKAHGDPNILLKDPDRKCDVKGCGNKHVANGYCRKHYRRVERFGTIKLTLPTGCVKEGCENTHFGKGYCKEHFYKSDYHKAIQQRRRAKIKNCQINDFKSSDWEIILYEFEGRCAYCGDESETLHQEHVKPLHNGGNNTLSNIVPSCPRCNQSKGTKDVADWYKEQPFYDKERFDAITEHTKEKNLV